jgi:branched-chain amino acid transport system permease protein
MVALIIGVCIGSIYAMMALSIAVVFRGTHMVNFAQGEMAALGVFVYIQWSLLGSGNPVVGTVIGLLVAGACGLLFGVLARRMAAAGGDLVPLIGSFGLFLVVKSVTVALWGPREPYQLPPIFGAGGVRISGAEVPYSFLGALGTTTVLGVVLFLVAKYTTLGLQLRAVVANREAAELAGLPTWRLQNITWFTGTVLAGVAAFLYFQNSYLVTGTIALVLIPSFAIAALGGFENFVAIAVGAFIFGIATQLLDRYTTVAGRDVIALAILVGLLFLVPRGLMVARSQRYT